MPLDLPDNDDGPEASLFGKVEPSQPQKGCARAKAKANPKPKASKSRSTVKKRPASSSSASRVAPVSLPSIDDSDSVDLFNVIGGDLDLEQPDSDGHPEIPLPDPDTGLLPFNDPTLKESAASIPSRTTHPYRDLDAVLRDPRPCDPSLVDSLWEIYSVPRMQQTMISMGGTCRRSYDIKMFWDLRQESYQRCLLQDLAILQPRAVMLCPPCTYVCQLMHSNWKKMKAFTKYINLQDACDHIDFSMWIASYQHGHSRHFAFEHPGGSLAWDRDSVTQLNSHTCPHQSLLLLVLQI